MKNIYLALLHSYGLSQKRLLSLINGGIGIQEFHDGLSIKKLKSLGITEKQAQKILDRQESFDQSEFEKKLKDLDVQMVIITEDRYPSLLREVTNSPAILYVRGQLPDHDRLLSVVGSRKYSQYAHRMLEKILPDILAHNYEIVSGGALGIDSLAHGVSIHASKPTYSVIGSGIDLLYPSSHIKMFENIITGGGAVISQFPLGTPPEAYNFPIRNEVIAGMSRGILVGEAAEKSGSLITAQLAVESGRDIFTFPHDIGRPTGVGSNNLIRDGLAKLVTSARDILIEYEIFDEALSSSQASQKIENIFQRNLYELLLCDSMTIDEIASSCGQSTAELVPTLSLMEVSGYIQTDSNGKYAAKI